MCFSFSVIVTLTIYRAVKTGVRSNDRLVQTLYRDGLFYFLYLLSESRTSIGFFMESHLSISHFHWEHHLTGNWTGMSFLCLFPRTGNLSFCSSARID